MTNQAGTRFERELLNGLRAAGYDVDRLARAGTRDEGDLVIRRGGLHVVVEAKNRKRLDLPTFVDEAEAERLHYAKARSLDAGVVHGVAFVKRRGKGWAGAYAVTTVPAYLDLLGV